MVEALGSIPITVKSCEKEQRRALQVTKKANHHEVEQALHRRAVQSCLVGQCTQGKTDAHHLRGEAASQWMPLSYREGQMQQGAGQQETSHACWKASL